MQDNKMKEKTPLLHELCSQMHNTRLQLKSFFIKFSEKITSFSKTTVLQREPLLTMVYTINSSLLLATKYVFMLAVILSN